VSYAQYIIHVIVFMIFPLFRLERGTVVALFMFLLPWSWVFAIGVHEPCKRLWRVFLRRRKDSRRSALLAIFVPSSSLCILLIVVVSIGNALLGVGCGGLPCYVVVERGAAIDLHLNWTSPESVVGNPDYDDFENPPMVSMAVINPSLLQARGKYIRAARVHYVTEKRESGTYYTSSGTIITNTWHSGVVFDVHRGVSLGGWDAAKWNLDGDARPLVALPLTSNLRRSGSATDWTTASSKLCEPKSTWIPENKTLLRKVVDGPEDPKLFHHPPASQHGAWGVAFSSLPPAVSRPGCDDSYKAVPQMYLAADGSSAWKGQDTVAMRLQCGYTRLYAEKNWIAFTLQDQLNFVYNIHPHIVVQARAADGACHRRYATSSYTPLADVFSSTEYRLSGSATATRWDAGNFVGLMHAKDVDGGHYNTFAYMFDAEPPFAVTRVSRPLPLQGNERAFASGLLVDRNASKVVVSYGYADQQSRALVMSVAFFSHLFDWCE